MAFDISGVLQDSDMGSTDFTVVRTIYRRQNGQSVGTTQSLSATGTIHPGSPKEIQYLPEEMRNESFISIHTGFVLTEGENFGEVTYTVPDRIVWKNKTWRVVSLKNWSEFGFMKALAVEMHET